MSLKTVIILAAVLALLLMLAVGVGACNEGPEFSGASDFADNFSPSGFMEAVGGLLRPLSPRVELGIETVVVPAGSSRSFFVGPSDARIRRADFRLQQGVAVGIAFIHADPPGDAENPETLQLTSASRAGGFAVLEAGGQLVINCPGGIQCVVALE